MSLERLVLKFWPGNVAIPSGLWGLSASISGTIRIYFRNDKEIYFRNDKEGQQQCGNPSAANGGLCTSPNHTVVAAAASGATLPCTQCCLSGVRAELSLPNIGAEIADFVKVMPASHPLHIGIYFGGYSHCATPSAAYTKAALLAVLHNPAVSGATIYTTETPRVACDGPNATGDKGCIVKEVFGKFGPDGAA